MLGRVPAALATLAWGDPNSPEPPWNSPLLLLLVSVEETERGFPNRDLAGSAGGFPNKGAAGPNILEPEATGSTLLLLAPNNPENKT